MTKRTAVCGVPMYVVRRQLLPLVVFNSVFVVALVVVSELVMDRVTDFLIAHRDSGFWMLIVLVLVGFVPLVSSVWLMVQAKRYTKRMKRLKGRACFVCNYEIAEGLDRCSECGAVWSLDDLNRYWRRNVGAE